MAKIIVVVERIKDWNTYFPAEKLMTAQDYLTQWDETDEEYRSQEKIKVINLCRSYKYLSNGYYCSLLAEARGHSVIPTIKAINDLSRPQLYTFDLSDLEESLKKHIRDLPKDQSRLFPLYFGKTEDSPFMDWGRQLFELFPAPILNVEMGREEGYWKIKGLRLGSLLQLSSHEEDLFALSLDEYSNKVWRRPRAKKKWLFDLAILHNPQERFPPSDQKALKQFIKAGEKLDILVELIEKKDFPKLAEYDGLFIRETTSLNHHTYRLAKKGQSEGLVVIDDPMSILKCTNKIYLANLLKAHKLKHPATFIVSKDERDQFKKIVQTHGFPLIAKVPDGSFSRGVDKVSTWEELTQRSDELFKKTSLVLLQEYLYTEFDWRIGVLNGEVLFACKYHMSRGHWQIYQHQAEGRPTKVGKAEGVPIEKVPKFILTAAIKSSELIGDGLYGVDIKEEEGKAYIIEINDNPNIDYGVEDQILGEELYQRILQDFLRRRDHRKISSCPIAPLKNLR